MTFITLCDKWMLKLGHGWEWHLGYSLIERRIIGWCLVKNPGEPYKDWLLENSIRLHQNPVTAISKHEFLSEFWNCPLVFCSHLLYYAIQALCDIFQCSLCIQRMWIAVSTNKFIWGTNYIQLHYWLRRTSGAIFFLEIRISMAADVGLWDSMTVMMQFLLLLGRCLCDLLV